MSNPLVTNFTVGPSKLYHTVENFLIDQIQKKLPEISHRGTEMTGLSKNTISALREFFEIPKEYRIYYTASATEGMEIFSRGGVDKKICHIVNGNFGNSWAKQSMLALKEVQKRENQDGSRVEIEDFLPDSNTEFLAITGNETATGIAYNSQEITEIRNKHPNLLLGVDITSSMGAVKYDFSSADGWFYSIQKGMGLPAGLGMVFVSPRLFEKCKAREQWGEDIGCHHSIMGLEKMMATKFQTPTTPNMLAISGVGHIARQFKKDFGNIQNLYEITKQKAEKLYEFFDTHEKFTSNVKRGRSETTIVIDGSEEDISALHKKLAESNIVVGKGYGQMEKKQIRIANFPVHSMEDVQNLLKKIG